MARTITFDGAGKPSADAWVVCPRSRASVPLAQCKGCSHMRSITAGTPERPDAVVCEGPEAVVTPTPLPLRLPRLTAGDLMTRNVVCVRMHLSLDALVQLFLETGLPAVPVVDERGCVLGVVAQVDVQLALQSERVPYASPVHVGQHAQPRAPRSVAEVMLPVAISVGEHTSIGEVSALLVAEGLQRVPVVASSGQVVGILSTSDILHWLASEDGRRLPQRRS